MSGASPEHVTRLLAEISRGDAHASDELMPLVYGELRKLAQRRLAREKPGQTLQPTALVHEAYLRLVKGEPVHWDNRRHFFAAAAQAMRRILIERARRYARRKRGAEFQRVTLPPDVRDDNQFDYAELLSIHEALQQLETLDPAMAKIVELRYFGGLTIEEVAHVLDTSPRTVNRLWTGARAWLYRALMGSKENPKSES